MSTLIYWFRNDLRLADNPAFTQACLNADHLLPVYIHDLKEQETVYGFKRQGTHQQAFLRASLDDLGSQLRAQGSDLLEFSGRSAEVLLGLFQVYAADVIYCEQIEAPEEIEQVRILQKQGVDVQEFWQSSMLDPQTFPFELEKMPDVFTAFRREVERAQLKFAKPIDAPQRIPELASSLTQSTSQGISTSSSFTHPYLLGGSCHAQAHLEQYLERRLPDSYKETRNQLIGMDYSSKFSAWLALGCLSARDIAAQLSDYEDRYGANDGTYWLWFELLWRDYFRFLHFKYGQKLYWAGGLTGVPVKPSYATSFEQWRTGNTGAELVDAGMRELHQSGYLSNRMRQIVASYWIYDMQGDWRAGAAWFESQLIDYDVYSNQGNWLYIAGRGTDPRGGRPFNVAKQTQDHDSQRIYRKRWLSS
ncbi:MAG: deoxyribodipyrimidine photolyase [Polynucleobacter sp. 24-46-87]|jgi:deoxyribodipyrimidine photo-lyase|uniref:DASH family cryptochrome n=1 Tax=unclassified Polynucleobacter TaxID=2640945 RepID=UPI000BDC327F|nr:MULTISPECIES: DASH family cryptochrome [unclassified Polynucleobacter]OYY21694.1 MAG: deoxyribodipyrimidine photolyase [Polynucleobacter sp. 35-46-11]OZA16027.1 MAG: deoxyribodipyrimidine photolyase [Polynucleobacter sp. 24-46-87]OZA76961.1 MAG: deoxyribodipyrimidine photolyase [Polynucleobacter sp. 39-46-10]